jgi:hypothetical protein
MRIELEHVAEGGPSESELDTVKLTVERFVVDSDEVLLVITGNYVETIRAHDTGGRTAARIDDDPMIPGSMAMMFKHDDGGYTIVVRQEIWSLEGRDPHRAVAHEALHIALSQRDEGTYRLDERFQQFEEAERHFVTSAGIVIEEYRVDRALCSDGFLGGDRDSGDFDADLIAFARDAAEAWRHVEAGDTDQDAFSAAVQTAFFQMIYTAAGTCARDLCSNRQRGPRKSEPHWTRLVGPHYERLRERLALLPDATQKTPRQDLENAAVQLIDPLISWATYFGWTVNRNQGIATFRTDWEL